MRNLLALVGLAVIVFGGLGWYLSWYKLNVAKDTDGNLQITTDVNTKKVENDTSAFWRNASAVIGNNIEKASQEAKISAPNTAPGSTPGPVTPPQNVTPDPVVPRMPIAPAPIPLKTPK